MPATCAAIGCSNNKANMRRLTFYYFPKKTSRRQEWVAAMKRENWTPTDHSRLCSEHFISGMKSDNPLSPDYIPSLFTFLSPEQRQQKINSYMEFQQDQMKKGIYNSLLPSTLDGDNDTEDDTDSSNGIQDDEYEIQIVKHEEETIANTPPTMDKMNEDFKDCDDGTVQELTDSPLYCKLIGTYLPVLQGREFVFNKLRFNVLPQVKRQLEVEAGEIENGGHCSQINEAGETIIKNVTRNRFYNRSALGHLTKKFIDIIGCSDKLFDLNDVVEKLGVPKRRLYDITNVLQGIRFLEKASKNVMRWLGPPLNESLKTEIKDLVEQEMRLDDLINDCRLEMQRLCEDSYSHGFAYLTYNDLQMIPTFNDQAVIVIKAPTETKLEVSHPHEGFRIHVRSSQGPIDVLMCHNDPVPKEELA